MLTKGRNRALRFGISARSEVPAPQQSLAEFSRTVNQFRRDDLREFASKTMDASKIIGMPGERFKKTNGVLSLFPATTTTLSHVHSAEGRWTAVVRFFNSYKKSSEGAAPKASGDEDSARPKRVSPAKHLAHCKGMPSIHAGSVRAGGSAWTTSPESTSVKARPFRNFMRCSKAFRKRSAAQSVDQGSF